MAKKAKQKKDLPVLKKTFSNRRESLVWENSLNDSLDQWDQTKINQQKQAEIENFLVLQQKRELEAKGQKQKMFEQKMQEELQAESDSLAKRVVVDEKIRNKKRKEIKKRDIAFRNKSIYG
ncbi:MAG: hypothetical protein HUJ42_03150 [Malacoplasma sp.]|nr:hypothetical protein [Malacoplasma sp.]